MGKWTKAAKALKVQMDQRDEMASDMEILISKLTKLPPGQLKKLLDEETVALLSKYGITIG